MAYDPRNGGTEDAALLAQAATGDARAATELYRRHARAVYRYAWLASGSEAEAADVLQEAFLAAFERAHGFDPQRGSFAAYLCGIARHLLYKRYDARVQALADTESLADGAVELPALPHEQLERAQALAR
ncbi:MAG TPA: sigma-70 family RNA polymerase sigma factor, partial [Burkholderiaceae bacterium]|nr:sigma-70 family RNA polymerase sigma factor [Burkholderiaceae bacterium]